MPLKTIFLFLCLFGLAITACHKKEVVKTTGGSTSADSTAPVVTNPPALDSDSLANALLPDPRDSIAGTYIGHYRYKDWGYDGMLQPTYSQSDSDGYMITINKIDSVHLQVLNFTGGGTSYTWLYSPSNTMQGHDGSGYNIGGTFTPATETVYFSESVYVSGPPNGPGTGFEKTFTGHRVP